MTFVFQILFPTKFYKFRFELTKYEYFYQASIPCALTVSLPLQILAIIP